MTIEAPADPLRFEEAVAWFSARAVMTRAAWDALEVAARSRAFTVSGLTSLALLTEVHDAIGRAVAEGTTLADFKRTVGPQLADAWGAPNAARVETVFRTNTQAAYNAGRYEQLNRRSVRAARPFWRFSAVLDGRTTDTCSPLDQVIRPAGDAFWSTHWPPLHFNCRSTVVSLSRGQAAAAGGVTEVPEGDGPAAGFGGTPDLAGAALAPPATAPSPLADAWRARARSRSND